MNPKFEVTPVIILKACKNPGCGGDVSKFYEVDGVEYRCLQCGRLYVQGND